MLSMQQKNKMINVWNNGYKCHKLNIKLIVNWATRLNCRQVEVYAVYYTGLYSYNYDLVYLKYKSTTIFFWIALNLGDRTV